MEDRAGASPSADYLQRPGPANAYRAATWALALIVQPVLGAAIGLQRAFVAFDVTGAWDRTGPILGAAGAACVAVGVGILLRRSPRARIRALARCLFAAAVVVPLSAVVLAVLLYE